MAKSIKSSEPVVRRFNVTVTGKTPYMQHRMDTAKLQEWEKEGGRIIKREGVSDAEKLAYFHSYINKDGMFYIPSEHFKQSFVKGGAFVKAKVGGSSRSMKNVVAGMWMITPEQIPFRPFDEVDTRSAVNNNVKARIIVHRPKWITWECSFILEVDDEGLLTKDIIYSIMDYAGRFLGIGSYRPEHTGEYGRYKITTFTEI